MGDSFSHKSYQKRPSQPQVGASQAEKHASQSQGCSSQAEKRPSQPQTRPSQAENRPKIGPNSIQNRFKSDLKSDFKTNTVSKPILDRFSIDFEAIGSAFLIDFQSSSMQRFHYIGIYEFVQNV